MLDRTIPPQAASIDKIEISQAITEHLDNGIPVHYIQAGEQEVLRIELVFKAGNWFEPKKGVSFFTTKMLAEGTKEYSAQEITSTIDQYGAFLELNSGVDYSFLTLYTLTKHLPKLLTLLTSMVFDSTFPEEELSILKKIKKQKIKIEKKKNNVLVSRKFREALYGKEHPYGRLLEEDDVPAIQRDELIDFHKQHIQNNFEIIISGKVTPEVMVDLNRSFGQQPYQLKKDSVVHKLEHTEKSLVVELEESMQSSIRVGKRLFKKDHPDYIPMQVVNEILGGYFGSRLMKNIREDKGYTYGISSSILSLKHEGFFIVGTDVKKEFTQSTLNEINKEVNLMSRELIGKEELNTVKNYMLGSFLADINNPFSLADKFKSIYLNGQGYEYYQQYIDTIKDIKAEQIKDLVNKYLKPETFSEVIVGGK